MSVTPGSEKILPGFRESLYAQSKQLTWNVSCEKPTYFRGSYFKRVLSTCKTACDNVATDEAQRQLLYVLLLTMNLKGDIHSTVTYLLNRENELGTYPLCAFTAL